MKLDAHVHIWDLARGDYGWLSPDTPAIYRDVGLAEVLDHAARCGINSVILVQAAPTVEETEFLLGVAALESAVAGVVGWVDFAAADTASLKRVAENRKLVGVRPMLQDVPTPCDLVGPDADPLFQVLVERGLVFDALVRADQIDLISDLAARQPDLKIVLDHGGKPPLRRKDLFPWRASIAGLAHYPNVRVKLSGLQTEANVADDIAVEQAVRFLLDSFGYDRCLWGSDWPMLSMAGDYKHWHDLVLSTVSEQGDEAITAVFGEVARQLYLGDVRHG